MRELYFVSHYRRSIRTIHFQYGSSGNKFILKITSGEINGKGTSEGNTEEVVFEGEQELYWFSVNWNFPCFELE